MNRSRVCYVQTVDELVYEEPLVPDLFREELKKNAGRLSKPAIEEIGAEILCELTKRGESVSNSSMLPGNIAFVAKMLKEPQLCGVLLEVKRDTKETRDCCNRFKRLCDECGISLRVIRGRWRGRTGTDRLLAKAQFEFEILCQLRDMGADVVMFDRAMFYSAVLIDTLSPISKNVLNSHPGILQGSNRNPGKEPLEAAFGRKLDQNYTSSTVTVHRAEFAVDSGEILVEDEFDITDIQSTAHLRTRIYSGLEACCQCRALRAMNPQPVKWNELRFPDPSEIERMYKSIVVP